ncbi:MAG TPA: hypothetical protein VMI75_39780 [Polyangiaceae bacterium]|nr:hypothetical protein [Polyangiaceae bacterium]
MKLTIVLVGAVLAGACSKSSGDSRSSAAPSASTATATATATITITMPPPAGATAPHPGPPQGACATLAEKCKKCPPATLAQRACTVALNAGNMDPSVCTNALNSKDINAQCN